jgi:hypothetical protein
MTSVIRSVIMGLCVFALVGIAGCSTSNESEAAQKSNLGDAGVEVSKTADPNGAKGYADWGKRADSPGAAGYPGTGTGTKKK